jgi:hypothetical protein
MKKILLFIITILISIIFYDKYKIEKQKNIIIHYQQAESQIKKELESLNDDYANKFYEYQDSCKIIENTRQKRLIEDKIKIDTVIINEIFNLMNSYEKNIK